ncbi:HIT domain-containing protein [Tsukamurella paurometabola]|uniref:HIT domain n=1 Tax=Tsukamurella paurometabola TaxID=2061 RepID=A0A3P8MAR5_TSUPA|nr:HIT domain-containing protein [Tsukamurella paurometabola]UEA84471.1 HIT domain-containing protein [Tsukamurella paurometabola]VDR37036.1 HIT domain [Tsukamurella paurometabola]
MGEYAGTDFYCDVAIPRRRQLVVTYEDEDVLAFEHTRPYWQTHLVVVPTLHVGSLLELEPGDLAAKLLLVVQDTARAVVRRAGAAAVTSNLGDYQDSKHLHFHVHAGRRLE